MWMQRHVSADFLSMLTWLRDKYTEQDVSRTGELSVHYTINALGPCHSCPPLNGDAHTLCIWTAKHDRCRCVDPSTYGEAVHAAHGVMSEIAWLGV